MKAAVERTHGAEVVRGVGSFGGVFSAKAIARWTTPCSWRRPTASAPRSSWPPGSATCAGRHRHRQPLHRRRPRAGGPAAVLPRLHRRQPSSTPTSSPRSSPAWPRRARRPGARCSAARRPRCRASTRRARFDVAGTLVGVAERAALLPRPDVAAGDVLVGVASSGPHTNGYSLLRRLFDWIPMDVVPGRPRPPARRRRCSSRTAATSTCSAGAGDGPGQGARPHHRRRPAGERAAGAAPRRRRPDRARLVAGAAAVPAGARAGDRASTTTSCTARSTWASGWSSSARRRAAAVQASIAEETWVIGGARRRCDRFAPRRASPDAAPPDRATRARSGCAVALALVLDLGDPERAGLAVFERWVPPHAWRSTPSMSMTRSCPSGVGGGATDRLRTSPATSRRRRRRRRRCAPRRRRGSRR